MAVDPRGTDLKRYLQEDPDRLNGWQVRIMPCLNPDNSGRARTNPRGVDLNRNFVDFSGRREPGAAGLAGPSRAAPSRAAPGARRPQQPGIRGSAADDGPEPNSPADAPRQAHPEAADDADEAEQATQGHADRQTHHVAQPCVHLASVGWQQPSRDVLGTSDR